jgi:hypothetical protein
MHGTSARKLIVDPMEASKRNDVELSWSFIKSIPFVVTELESKPEITPPT